MDQNGSNCFKIAQRAQNGEKAQIDSKCSHMDQISSNWLKMVPNCWKWLKMSHSQSFVSILNYWEPFLAGMKLIESFRAVLYNFHPFESY